MPSHKGAAAEIDFGLPDSAATAIDITAPVVVSEEGGVVLEGDADAVLGNQVLRSRDYVRHEKPDPMVFHAAIIGRRSAMSAADG